MSTPVRPHIDCEQHHAILSVSDVPAAAEAIDIFAKVLARPVRALHVSAGLFRLQQLMLAPFSPAGANLMGMNWIVASADTRYDMKAVAPLFGVSLTTMEQLLRHKMSLASE